jgi:hypothetical protein
MRLLLVRLSETDPNIARCCQQWMVERDKAWTAGDFSQGYANDAPGCLATWVSSDGHHHSMVTLSKCLDRGSAECSGKCAVRRCRSAAALQVTEDDSAHFRGEQGAELLLKDDGNAAVLALIGEWTESLVDSFATNRFGAFRNGDDREVASTLPSGLHNCDDSFQGEGELWQQDDICTTRDTGVERDPAGIAPHEFDEHDTVVTLGGGMESINGFRGRADCGVKPDGHGGPAHIVVDRFGYSDDAEPEMV